jgi:hypothetical protein
MFTIARRALAFALLTLSLTTGAMAQDAKPEVLVTSSGQALDAFTAKTLLARAGVKNDYDPHAGVANLEGRKALVIAFGASVKGFGAAGITADTEIARTNELLAAADAAGVKIIGVHIGGAERRQGLSEQFVQLVSGKADALVVWQAGNEDGYFTKVAADRGIPLVVIGKLAEAGTAIAAQTTAE